MRTPELCQLRHSGVFIANFEQISQRINKIYYNIIYFTACSRVSIVNLLLIILPNIIYKKNASTEKP